MGTNSSKLSQSSATLGTCSLQEVAASWLQSHAANVHGASSDNCFPFSPTAKCPLLTRGKVYSSCVRSVMLHAAETWAMKADTLNRLESSPTFSYFSYFFALFLLFSYFFLKYSYYSYFLNETKRKNVYVSLLQKKTCYKIYGLMAYTDVLLIRFLQSLWTMDMLLLTSYASWCLSQKCVSVSTWPFMPER